ncbi:hypothetical protein Zmor_019192 [Zophobas morio]|uniref:Uncharacterized protein n=1 Tax=Zophobas morio TaxID=2755281 RepID=A0AA38HZ82_9CUCU|nr:hypothetical protein Zmor_019192 [Zophobas morio]
MGHLQSKSRSSAILAATSFICWTRLQVPPAPKCLHLTFASVTCTAFFAVEIENDRDDKVARRNYRRARHFQTFFALPSFTTALWLTSSYSSHIFAWCLTLLQIFPFLYYIKMPFTLEVDELFNELALMPALVITLSEENYYGTACAMAYDFGRFCLKYGKAFQVPHVCVSNYFLCLFVLLASKAVDRGHGEII